MNLLLDTHTFIWVFDSNPTLSFEARAAIADGENEVFVSAATAWEIAIKRAIGKLRLKGNVEWGLARYRFSPLPITIRHALAVEGLPPHHMTPSTACSSPRPSSSV
jgi:PIN domain nuclease of toxin-antitoxin system